MFQQFLSIPLPNRGAKVKRFFDLTSNCRKIHKNIFFFSAGQRKGFHGLSALVPLSVAGFATSVRGLRTSASACRQKPHHRLPGAAAAICQRNSSGACR